MKQLKFNRSQFHKNRFNYLLTVLLGLFIISPFFQAEGTMSFNPVLAFVYLFAMIAIFRSIIEEDREFYILASMKIASFVLDMLAHFHLVSTFEHSVHLVARFIQIVLMFVIIVHLIKWLFSVERVDADTVKGGICVYILLGIGWMALYRFIYEIDSNSFSMQFGSVWEFMYFSFTTLTSVGYGDITPASSFAMMLTNLEGMAGQLFLAIFVARLVGLHIAHNLKQ